MTDSSYFPAIIRYSDTGEDITVEHPDEIQTERPFRILSVSDNLDHMEMTKSNNNAG